MIREIYGYEYNKTNEQREMKISWKNLRYKLKISKKYLRNLLVIYQNKNVLGYRKERDGILIKVPDFIKFASKWTIENERYARKKPVQAPAPIEVRSKK